MPEAITAKSFNRALAACIEGGVLSPMAVSEMLAKLFPRHDTSLLDKLARELSDIQSAAHRCVRNQLEDHQAEEIGRQAVADLDQRISPENAALLYTQARVAAWRDGYS